MKRAYSRIANGDRKTYKEAVRYLGKVKAICLKYLKDADKWTRTLKNLSSIAKRIAEYRYDREQEEIKEVVRAAAREYGCSQGEIRLRGIEYPEDIVW